MPWIESHASLARHPKTLRLARTLGVPVPCAIGHLHLLWWWTLEYAQDGNLAEFGADEIAIACMWDGEPDALLAALRCAGFVDESGAVHDWEYYAGRLIDARRRSVERAQAWRDQQRTRNVPSIVSAPNAFVTRNERVGYDATVPNRTVPNLTQPATPNGVAMAPDADAPDAISPSDAAPAPLVRSVPKPQRARDRIFDAFLAIFAGDDDSFVTDAERGKWNAAAKGFRTLAARKGIAEEQMAALICEAHEHWPNVKGDTPETPNGLLTNFSTLLRGPQVNGRSAGTVRRHEQKVTESALLLADGGLRAAREARDAHRRLIDHGGT